MNRKAILVLGITVLALVPVLTGVRGCNDYMDEGFSGSYSVDFWVGESRDSCDIMLYQHEDGSITGRYEYSGGCDPAFFPTASGNWDGNLTTFTVEGEFCEYLNPTDCWDCSSLFHGSGTDLDGDGYYDTIEGTFRGTCPCWWYEAVAGTFVGERYRTPPK